MIYVATRMGQHVTIEAIDDLRGPEVVDSIENNVLTDHGVVVICDDVNEIIELLDDGGVDFTIKAGEE